MLREPPSGALHVSHPQPHRTLLKERLIALLAGSLLVALCLEIGVRVLGLWLRPNPTSARPVAVNPSSAAGQA
jgi:hypothetical protein